MHTSPATLMRDVERLPEMRERMARLMAKGDAIAAKFGTDCHTWDVHCYEVATLRAYLHEVEAYAAANPN